MLELGADGDFLPPTFIVNALPSEHVRISKVFSGTYTVAKHEITSDNLKQQVVTDSTNMGITSPEKKVKKGKQ